MTDKILKAESDKEFREEYWYKRNEKFKECDVEECWLKKDLNSES